MMYIETPELSDESLCQATMHGLSLMMRLRGVAKQVVLNSSVTFDDDCVWMWVDPDFCELARLQYVSARLLGRAQFAFPRREFFLMTGAG